MRREYLFCFIFYILVALERFFEKNIEIHERDFFEKKAIVQTRYSPEEKILIFADNSKGSSEKAGP